MQSSKEITLRGGVLWVSSEGISHAPSFNSASNYIPYLLGTIKLIHINPFIHSGTQSEVPNK